MPERACGQPTNTAGTVLPARPLRSVRTTVSQPGRKAPHAPEVVARLRWPNPGGHRCRYGEHSREDRGRGKPTRVRLKVVSGR